RRVSFRRPEKERRTTDLMLSDQAIRRAARRCVEADRGIALLMTDLYDALGAGEGVFHRREPPAQRIQLSVGELVQGWSRNPPRIRRRLAPSPQRKGYDVRLVEQLVHGSPTCRARNPAETAPNSQRSPRAQAVVRIQPNAKSD